MVDFKPGIDLPKIVQGRSAFDISPDRNKTHKVAGIWQVPQDSETQKQLERYLKAALRIRAKGARETKLVERWMAFIRDLGEKERCTALAAIRYVYLRTGGVLGKATVPLWEEQIDLLSKVDLPLAKQIANDTLFLTPPNSRLEQAAESALSRFERRDSCSACPHRSGHSRQSSTLELT